MASTVDIRFSRLAERISVDLGASCVLITELREGSPVALTPLTFWADGSPASFDRFEADGSPCGVVLEKGTFTCTDRLADRFPDFLPLRRLGAQSYVGASFRGDAGATLGHLGVLDTRPRLDFPELLPRVQAFATLLAADLQMLRDRAPSPSSVPASEERYRRMAENIPGVVYHYVRDPDGTRKMLYANPRLGEILGPKTAELILGDLQRSHRIVHPEDREAFLEARERTWSSGEEFDMEFRARTDSGDYRWVRAVSRPTAIGGGKTISYGILLESTARKNAEDRFEALAENIPGAVFTKVVRADGSSTLSYLSEGFAEIVGPLTASRVGYSSDAFLRLIHEEDRDRFEHLGHLFERKMEPLDVEFRVRTDEGDHRWVRSISRPVPGAAGRILWHGILLDVTETKEMEKRTCDYAAALMVQNEALHVAKSASDEAMQELRSRIPGPLGGGTCGQDSPDDPGE